MDLPFNIDSELYWSVIFPVVIALSRVVDVIFGTFWIVLVIQGRKFLATIFGFFEVLIWVMVAGQVMGQLNNFSYYIAWALGFAIGTFIGMTIEEKISLGSGITSPNSLYTIENVRSVYQANSFVQDDRQITFFRRVFPRGKSK